MRRSLIVFAILAFFSIPAHATELELRLILIDMEKITTPLDLVQYERFKNQPLEENSVAREPILTKKDILKAYVLKKDGLRVGIIDLALKPEAAEKLQSLALVYAHREAFWMSNGKVIARFSFDKPGEKNMVSMVCRFMKSPDEAIQLVKDLEIPFAIKDPSMGDYEKPEKKKDPPYVPPPYEPPAQETSAQTKKSLKRSDALVG